MLGQLEKDFDLAHKGEEIDTNLAAIVSKLLKEKTEEDKLTEIKKRYPAPKNCDRLAETRVPICNRITSKLQRDKKESYRRGRQPERLDKLQRKRNYSGAKNYLRHSQYQVEEKKKVRKSQP